MEYKLVSAPMLDTIERVVNEAMAEGWTPHGSLVCAPSKYIQPMTREDVFMWDMSKAEEAEKEMA